MTTYRGLELTETLLTLISREDLNDCGLKLTYGHLYTKGFSLGLINELEYEFAGRYYGPCWNIKIIYYRH